MLNYRNNQSEAGWNVSLMSKWRHFLLAWTCLLLLRSYFSPKPTNFMLSVMNSSSNIFVFLFFCASHWDTHWTVIKLSFKYLNSRWFYNSAPQILISFVASSTARLKCDVFSAVEADVISSCSTAGISLKAELPGCTWSDFQLLEVAAVYGHLRACVCTASPISA